MNMIGGFVLSTIMIGLYLNLYKFNIMIDCYSSSKSYDIYPWSANPETSTSNPLWLIIHLATSIFHMWLTGFILVYPDIKPTLKTILSVSHCAFLFPIICNMWRLGDVTQTTAIIVNGIVIILTSLTYHSNWKYKDFIYFMLITLPVFIEAIRYAIS